MSFWDDMDEGLLSLQPRLGNRGLLLTMARTQPKKRSRERQTLVHQATVVGIIWGCLLAVVLTKAAT